VNFAAVGMICVLCERVITSETCGSHGGELCCGFLDSEGMYCRWL
jgi:hypothetical protein